MKVKVIGAGSIGNHLTHAARSLGWSVDLCDVDPEAIKRARTQIYPARYGNWDESIGTYLNQNSPIGGYDLICIGTPPDSHMELALRVIQEGPRAILIEKPLCGPEMKMAHKLWVEANRAGIPVFVGYDHVVGKAAGITSDLLSHPKIGKAITLDVEFREHWGGIFAAHPWLAGPWESYLGFSERGGGALGEHSHAINLWQHFAYAIGAGRVVEVQASMDLLKDGRVDYDRVSMMNLKTENGLVGRCIQDVVTQPPRKYARIQCDAGSVEWHCNLQPGVDVVQASLPGGGDFESRISKTRPDDFIEELSHISTFLNSERDGISPISLERGLDTMMVIAAAHLSNDSGRTIGIDYSKGYLLTSLSPI